MNPFCKPSEHVSRRALLKGVLAGAGGAIANWGALFNSQTIAAEAAKRKKRCILLWMNGGASQIDTFDMKPGTTNGGPFRPMPTNVPGMQVCEYMPRLAKMADRLAVIRSMHTGSPDHPDGIYHMHTGYKMSERVPHPEIGAMIAKYQGAPDSDLPGFVRMGPCGNAGSGYLGPKYQPFGIGRDGRLPESVGSSAVAELRRAELLRFMENEFSKEHKAEPFEAHRQAREQSWRLLKAKEVFDIKQENTKYRELYGDTEFGRGCLLARRLIESGVPFVEVGQDNYDSHADNFVCHKANLNVLDLAWSGLMQDLETRGLLKDTLIVWMGEVGRTPNINNRVGRDHYINGWTVVLAGGGIKGGALYGETNPDGRGVKDKPVNEGDLFATIYTTLGVDPRTKHYVGVRPIWAVPEKSHPIKELLG